MNYMDLKFLVGMNEIMALETLDNIDLNWRVVRRNSLFAMKTNDVVLDRVNLEIDDGKVTGAYYG